MLRYGYISLIAITVLAAAVLSPALLDRRAVAAEDKQVSPKASLLFNVTSGKNNVHAVSMALNLAGAAAKQGHEVVVFLNVEAPQFAAKNLGEETRVADFVPVKTLLAEVIAKGGKVFVCEHCARVGNVDSKALADGVIVAGHGEILGQVKPGTVCFSY